MNRFLIAAITLVALTAAAQAEIMCTSTADAGRQEEESLAATVVA